MVKKLDYRQYYKDYYNVDFGDDYVVHHMDFDDDNNDIYNLLMLPKKLYRRYMFYLNSLGATKGSKGIAEIDLKIEIQAGSIPTTKYKMIEGFCKTMEEINYWVGVKSNLDMNKYYAEQMTQKVEF